MEKSGQFNIMEWLNQNHDGLAHKAGFPAAKINEIHGSWLDKEKNPVVKMSGSLRPDLFQRVMTLEEQADFCFALGTSFSGMNTDRVAKAVAGRHMRENAQGLGLAVLTIQATPIDQICALRIFAKCDDFMMLVAQKLNLAIDMNVVYDYFSGKPVPAPGQRATLAQSSAATTTTTTTATTVKPTATTTTTTAASKAATAQQQAVEKKAPPTSTWK